MLVYNYVRFLYDAASHNLYTFACLSQFPNLKSENSFIAKYIFELSHGIGALLNIIWSFTGKYHKIDRLVVAT